MVAKSCASLLLLGRLAAGVSLAWVPGLALAQPPAVAAATPAPKLSQVAGTTVTPKTP